MADYTSTHTGTQIDNGITKTYRIKEGVYNLTENPTTGDWRIRQTSANHCVIERMDSFNTWTSYGEFGSSLTIDDLIFEDASGAVFYLDTNGNKKLLITASVVDGGVALGGNNDGLSLVHNGRLESFKESPTETTYPIGNDGSDISGLLSDLVYETVPTPDTKAINTVKLYFNSVPAGTRMRMTIPEHNYENVSEFDFVAKGSGDVIQNGEYTHMYSPNFRIPRNKKYTVNVFFTQPVKMIGDNSSGTFKPKFQESGYFL